MEPRIGVAELKALKAVADAIIADAVIRGDADFGRNFADVGGAGLPYIAVRPTKGNFGDTASIRASCPAGRALQVTMPFGAAKAARSVGRKADVTRTVFSALVHELVHVRQSNSDPNAFAVTSARQDAGENGNQARSPDEWIAGYYGEQLEFEAHAAQLAAELRLLGSRVAPDDPHGSWVGMTEVGRRMHGRLFPGTGDVAAADWWDRFLNAAAAMQVRWEARGTAADGEAGA